MVEGVVEGIRPGIQTAFYTVDYSTKPHMTCEPLLKHLAEGMGRLDAELQREREEEEEMHFHGKITDCSAQDAASG